MTVNCSLVPPANLPPFPMYLGGLRTTPPVQNYSPEQCFNAELLKCCLWVLECVFFIILWYSIYCMSDQVGILGQCPLGYQLLSSTCLITQRFWKQPVLCFLLPDLLHCHRVLGLLFMTLRYSQIGRQKDHGGKIASLTLEGFEEFF